MPALPKKKKKKKSNFEMTNLLLCSLFLLFIPALSVYKSTSAQLIGTFTLFFRMKSD
jgi:hypothetical protein